MKALQGLKIFVDDLDTWLFNWRNWQTRAQKEGSNQIPVVMQEIQQILQAEPPDFQRLSEYYYGLHELMLRYYPIEVFTCAEVWESYFDMMELIMSAEKDEAVPYNRLSLVTVKIIRN